MKNKTLAALDLGTNTFHLLVAEVTAPDRYTVVLDEKIPVMIGKEGISHGYITEDAQQRALAALQQFRQLMDQHHVAYTKATATSAFRNAKNGQDLVARIQQDTGIEVHVISGDQEAAYIYQGVREAVLLDREPALVVDIGGGSVEFIIGNADTLYWKQSFEIGAQRLLDRFQRTDPMHPEEVERMRRHFAEQLPALDEACQQYQPRTLVGASGAFDTFSDIYVHQTNLPTAKSAELPITLDGFYLIHQALTQKSREERLRIPGMLAMRVDMIVVASWLVDELIQRYRPSALRVSAYALKEGLLRETIDRYFALNR